MSNTINATGLTSYYPEMGEKKPEAQIEARLSHYGKHWYLSTRLTLKGRGIKFVRTNTAADMRPGSYRVGWNEYCVTELAFEKLCKEYAISTESLL